ncbi:MAG TPA: hypothetical protein DEP92_04000 [Candidatus Komeilibacteria bacterium]|nr:hypothetical protein [Candidatus Komeilibacteria bacterium]HCC73940.1 hypothetical protein [Candidatus Komeilibacteria bacterium]
MRSGQRVGPGTNYFFIYCFVDLFFHFKYISNLKCVKSWMLISFLIKDIGKLPKIKNALKNSERENL